MSSNNNVLSAVGADLEKKAGDIVTGTGKKKRFAKWIATVGYLLVIVLVWLEHDYGVAVILGLMYVANFLLDWHVKNE